MTELGGIFAELGISHYLHDFIEQGFDSWETILDIKESDFDALGVKLGHRRKLQRRIANARGLAADAALASSGNPLSEDRHADEQRLEGVRVESKDVGNGIGMVQSTKRKYRRHPKADEHAPDRPPSAYVIFSNKMREDLKGRNLSFTEIAKLVGEHWQSIDPQDKEPFEQQAFSAKERYNSELAQYKKTESYRTYSQYLIEFKARQSNQQPVNDLDSTKRPRLMGQQSTASSATISDASSLGIDTPGSGFTGSSCDAAYWQTVDAQSPLSVARPTNSIDYSKSQASPIITSPGVLPGFRESMYGGGPQQSLPWRDGPRDEGAASLQQLSRMPSVNERRLSNTAPALTEERGFGGQGQHPRRSRPSPAPHSLSSESTNMSTSSGSTVSSAFFTPRTPMESPHERAMPPLYPQKSNGGYEIQLPPLHPQSLSPQLFHYGSQQSPTGMYGHLLPQSETLSPSALPADFKVSAQYPNIDYHPTMAPLRNYAQPSSVQALVDNRQQNHNSSDSHEQLDPVDALLKASTIVNQKSQTRS